MIFRGDEWDMKSSWLIFGWFKFGWFCVCVFLMMILLLVSDCLRNVEGFNMVVVVGNMDYGDVLILLENCILSEDYIEKIFLVKDGLGKEVEIDFWIVGCEYI